MIIFVIKVALLVSVFKFQDNYGRHKRVDQSRPQVGKNVEILST